jgi:protoporphyrinogen oxidase
MKAKMTRRKYLRFAGLTGASIFSQQVLGTSGLISDLKKYVKPAAVIRNSLSKPNSEKNYSSTVAPIQRLKEVDLFSSNFNGDEIDNTHKILWNIEGYIKSKGGFPEPKEFVPLVIVGGGLSGLLSAYYLEGQKPLILESAMQFGGNSKAECIGNTFFSIGTAYITKPEPDSEIDLLLKDLKLNNKFREELADEVKISLKSKLHEKFWTGNTDPLARHDFERIFKKLSDILENSYPEIPLSENIESKNSVLLLDKMSFEEWIAKECGEIHQHIREFFQLYCWSSFGGSMDEISAAQALNFLAAETDAILAFPGGNAPITQALFNKLDGILPNGNLRSGCMTIDIRDLGEYLIVTYVDKNGNLHSIRTQKCIVACSKMLARAIIPQMEESQKKACDEITYRSYLVANVLLEKQFKPPCFDLFCLQEEVPPSPTALKPPKIGFTDICFGSWANENQSEHTVLTVYKPLPYQGARQFLFADYAHDKHKKLILESLAPYLNEWGISNKQIKGVRLTRWGHSMPLASTNMIASGILEIARASIRDKIYFANQDNFVNPCFETAIAVALKMKESFEKF